MENITASSSTPGYGPSQPGFHARCWKPLTTSDPDDYLQVDLGRLRVLTGVVTKAASSSKYVESYKLQYSIDGIAWKYYSNFNGTAKVFSLVYS